MSLENELYDTAPAYNAGLTEHVHQLKSSHQTFCFFKAAASRSFGPADIKQVQMPDLRTLRMR